MLFVICQINFGLKASPQLILFKLSLVIWTWPFPLPLSQKHEGWILFIRFFILESYFMASFSPFFPCQQKLPKWYSNTAESGPLQGIRHRQRNLWDFNAANAGEKKKYWCLLCYHLVFCDWMNESHNSPLSLSRSLKQSYLCTQRRLQSRSQTAYCMAPTVHCHLCTVSLCPSFPASWPGRTRSSRFLFSQVYVCVIHVLHVWTP